MATGETGAARVSVLESLLRGLVIVGAAVVLCVPLVVTPDAVFPHLAGKAALARAAIEAMTGVWALLLVLEPRRYRPRPSWVLVALGVYLAFTLLATCLSVSPSLSFWSSYQRQLGVVDLLHGVAFVLVLVSVLQSERSWRALLSWAMAVVLMMELMGIGEAFRLSFLERFVVFNPRLGGTTGNAAFLAGLLATALPVATGLLAHSIGSRGGASPPGPLSICDGEGEMAKGRWAEWGLRLLWALVVLLGVPVLFLTGTRGALVALVAGAVAMLAVSPLWGGWAMARRTAVPAGLLIGAVALTFGLYAAGIAPALKGPGQGEVTARIRGDGEGTVTGAIGGFREREDLWVLGIRGFLDHPILGYGPEGYPVPYDRHMDMGFVRRNGNTSNDKPHNKVIEELVSGGVLGAGSYLALWLVLAFVLLRRRVAAEAPVALGVLGALAAYFVQDLFLFDTPSGFWLLMVVIAWVAAYELRTTSPSVPGGSLTPRPPLHLRWRGGGRGGGQAGRYTRTPRPMTAADLRRLALLPVALVLAAGVGYGVSVAALRPYEAALAYQRIGDPDLTFPQRLDEARRALDSAPTSANTLRRSIIVDLANAARDVPVALRSAAEAFVAEESKRGLEAEPRDARLLRGYVTYRQATARDSKDLDAIDALIGRLVAAAPYKVTTQRVLVLQEVLRLRPQRALELIDQYVAQAPITANDFADLRQVAQAMVARG